MARRVGTLLAASAVGLLIAGCAPESESDAVVGDNVLLVTLDTTRADAIRQQLDEHLAGRAYHTAEQGLFR